MTKQNISSRAELERVGKFGFVGILNTLLDFAIFNVLTAVAGFTLVQSNIISTTIAMVFSFFANKNVVFKDSRGSAATQAVIFFAVTAFGLYVLQTGVIKLLTEVWLGPLNAVVALAHATKLSNIFSDSFIVKNGAKAAGTIISLTWNYIVYKKVVFR